MLTVKGDHDDRMRVVLEETFGRNVLQPQRCTE